MSHLQIYNVSPEMPPALEFLETLSLNMWWCWNIDAIDLYRRIDPELWKQAQAKPLKFISMIPQKKLQKLAEDDGFISHMNQIKERFEADLTKHNPLGHVDFSRQTAYFSLEFGIHESLHIYSGGLGILAGDHLKSASDLNTPLVAVGLLYRQGYFQQYLNKDGWQQETYLEADLEHLPIRRAYSKDGHFVQISILLPEGRLFADVWKLDVGTVPLYLLDTNISSNPIELRDTTSQLYGGDKLMRLRQELLLGIGGYRALVGLGYDPAVCHMNEGHAAFLSLARAEHLIKDKNYKPAAAREIISRSSVFTTHTPVPAGNETFPVEMLKPHLEALKDEMIIDPDQIIRDGQPPNADKNHEVSMTILGLRMAGFSNAVSKLHGEVSRKMWAHLWPERPNDEIPIAHITNGIHVPSWLSPDNETLYSRYLGPEWRSDPTDKDMLKRISNIPDEELWRAHEQSRSRLVRSARAHVKQCLQNRNACLNDTNEAETILDQNVLTIGFARRFATYKRATLLLSNPDRLKSILYDKDKPVQIIFAGKAHPADDHGKHFIQEIIKFANEHGLKNKIVFLENYDIHVARRLVQGVDVWLNNPRRPREASGTSGMKAAVNGVLNLSVLDGWWCEGYDKNCGWSIGDSEEYGSTEEADAIESEAIYNIIENNILPAFYNRPSGDFPSEWTKMMKASIEMSIGQFSSHRMVSEYSTRFYEPALEKYNSLADNNAHEANNLVKKRKVLDSLWDKIVVSSPSTDKDISDLHVGESFTVTTDINLGKLQPEDVTVQVYYGATNSLNKIDTSHFKTMTLQEDKGEGNYSYTCEISCKTTGRYGFTSRVIPSSINWKNSIPGYMTWAENKVAINKQQPST